MTGTHSDNESHLVYKTGIGRVRLAPRSGQPGAQKRSGRGRAQDAARPGARDDGKVRIFRQKGRGGGVISVINGLPDDPALLADLAQTLKRHVAAGGSVKGSEILIQGDHREKLAAKLKTLGYAVLIAGG
jgi:translation initiation factor 1